MATEYFVNAAGDNSDGLTVAKGFNALQTALALVVAGDTISVVGTISGANAVGTLITAGTPSARITIRGVNASGVYDGSTRGVLDRNGAATILTIGKDYYTIQCLTARRGTYGFLLAANNYGLIMENCLAELNTQHGFTGQAIYGWGTLRRCVSSQNTVIGFNGFDWCMVDACKANNNGNRGFTSDYSTYMNCIAVSNTDAGIALSYSVTLAINCIVYGNGVGIRGNRASSVIMVKNCKILSNATGILLLTNSNAIVENTGFFGNATKATTGSGSAIVYYTTSPDMASSGVVNAAGGDFNNTDASEAMWTVTDIDGTNKVYESAGLPSNGAYTDAGEAFVLRVADGGPPTWGRAGERGPGTAVAQAANSSIFGHSIIKGGN